MRQDFAEQRPDPVHNNDFRSLIHDLPTKRVRGKCQLRKNSQYKHHEGREDKDRQHEPIEAGENKYNSAERITKSFQKEAMHR